MYELDTLTVTNEEWGRVLITKNSKLLRRSKDFYLENNELTASRLLGLSVEYNATALGSYQSGLSFVESRVFIENH